MPSWKETIKDRALNLSEQVCKRAEKPRAVCPEGERNTESQLSITACDTSQLPQISTIFRIFVKFMDSWDSNHRPDGSKLRPSRIPSHMRLSKAISLTFISLAMEVIGGCMCVCLCLCMRVVHVCMKVA